MPYIIYVDIEYLMKKNLSGGRLYEKVLYFFKLQMQLILKKRKCYH